MTTTAALFDECLAHVPDDVKLELDLWINSISYPV